jgi:hypothetical protein
MSRKHAAEEDAGNIQKHNWKGVPIHPNSQNRIRPLRQRSEARLSTTPGGNGKYKRTRASRNNIKTTRNGSIISSSSYKQ